MDKRPIAVFDSGVGGITVLKEIIKLLPNEDIIYLGDTSRMPYGTKSKENIIEFTGQCIDFLLSKNVKAIVIACGTATSQAIEEIKVQSDIPVIGIIKPTVLEVSKEAKSIGVIATNGTINSGAWKRELQNANPNLDVLSIACPLLAQMAEEGWINNEIAKLTIKEYLKPFKNTDISMLILGCTHYPLFQEIIRNELKEDIEIINTGEKTSKYLKEVLIQKNILNLDSNKPRYKIYLTDIGGNFVSIANDLLKGIIEINENIIEKIELY